MNFEFHVSGVLLIFLIYQTRKEKKELKKGRVSSSSLWGGMATGRTLSIDKQIDPAGARLTFFVFISEH